MTAIRSKDTKPEMALRRALWARGHRYRLHGPDLPGRPDLVFWRQRVAIFVDGDFWHGRLIQEGRTDAFARQFRRRRAWWMNKIQTNIARDLRVTARLEASGWVVVRLWESAIRANVEGVVQDVESVLGTW